LGGRDLIVSGSHDGTVRIWDTAGSEAGNPLTGHIGPVYAVAIGSLDGRNVIVSGSHDGTVRIWDTAGIEVGNPLTGHLGPVYAVAIAHLGNRDVIVSAGNDRTLRLWTGDGSSIGEPVPLLEPCASIAVVADGLVLATGNAIVRLKTVAMALSSVHQIE